MQNCSRNEMEKVKRVKQKYEPYLLRKAGVKGCAIGYKWVGGKKIDKLCIICYVEKKKTKRELRKEDIIPEEIEGVPTDVVELGPIHALEPRLRKIQ